MVKHFQIYVSLILILFISACSSSEKQKVTKPENLIEETQMAHIVADLGIAESMIRTGANKRDSMIIFPDSIYQGVFEKYNIDKEQLKQSFKWYINNPKKLESIFNQSITILTQQESNLSSKTKQEAKGAKTGNKKGRVNTK